jgi:hypothetical protein
MLTPEEFARRQREINEEIKMAVTEHRKALAARRRANKIENGNAKNAANKAVDKAKTEVDLLIEKMSKLMNP